MEPLKNTFDRPLVEKLAAEFRSRYKAFPVRTFVGDVLDDEWAERELKARIRHLSLCLGRALPTEYRAALAVLLEVAPGFGGMVGMVFPDFVEVFGTKDWDASVPALRVLTSYSTSEFAVRPFIIEDQARMLSIMREWADDPDEHVRRLASEGSRPRLPWGGDLPSLKRDPKPVLPLLERLRADPSEYVRRSVANNLNDITKDHPETVLRLAARWHGQHGDTDRLLKHACRTLLKQGEVRALRLFGFPEPTGLSVSELTLEAETLEVGETLVAHFDLHLEGPEDLRLRLDFAIDYATLRGDSNRKVYKISERTMAPGSRSVTRRQSFSDRSTRRHRPGTHRVTILGNGVELSTQDFEVVEPNS